MHCTAVFAPNDTHISTRSGNALRMSQAVLASAETAAGQTIYIATNKAKAVYTQDLIQELSSYGLQTILLKDITKQNVRPNC